MDSTSTLWEPVSPLDSTAWLGARIGSLLLGSSKVGMCARHAKQRVDMGQCAGTVQAQVEREVDLAVANRCEEADAWNRSIWPSKARRNREPWHAAGACNAAYGRIFMAGGSHELRERLSSVEVVLGAVPDGEDVCDLVARVLNLEASLLHIQESLMEEMAQIRKNNEDLRYEIIILRRAMASSSEVVPQRPLVRVPEPKSFGGTRSAKELENFLWDMEQYFVAAKVPETEKVTISSMYLIGDAKLWWRTRMVDDANAGRQKIDTWDRLKKEMKDQFLLDNTSWIARDGLKRLKQSGSVRDYVKEFSSLMLDIQNMSEEDKLYNFLYDLQPWAQVELRRQNVRDLPSAITAADALVDLCMSKENLNMSSSSKSNFVRKDKKGDWKKEGKKDAKKKDSGNNHGKGKAEHSAKLNALLLGDKEDDYEHEVATLVNPLKLLNTIVAYEPLELLTNMSEDMVRAHSQLLHVSVMLNRKSAYAMVDTGATHTFVSAKLVQEYGLSIRKCPKYIKSVNAKAQAIVGMAYNVPLTVGTQVGKANMMVIPLEDFQIILGMDFLRKTKTVPMPHLDGVMAMQESNPCFVSAMHPYGKDQNKGKTNIISAISLEKGLRRGETTYLAALIDAKPDQNVELPVGIQDILLKFEDARWQEFLAEYDFDWEHKPGKHNQVADALSRKEVFATFYSISRVESDMLDRIKAVAASDIAYGKLVQQVRDGVIRRYWIEDDLLVYKGGRVFVPAAGGLRKELLKETHDPLWAGHPGVERMLALLARSYIWTKMENDVEAYVKTCLVDGMSSIMVVVDRFSKYAIFIAAPSACPSDVAAELFYRHVVKFFGLPNDIVSDRDTRFTGRFWTALFNMMGTDLKFSTANHPQTDGQTERINHVLEEYLRHYVTASQKNWLGLLDSAQFCYNLHKSSATEKSPFEIVMSEQPTTPMEIAKQKSGGKCLAAYRYAREKQELLEEAQDTKRIEGQNSYAVERKTQVRGYMGKRCYFVAIREVDPSILTEAIDEGVDFFWWGWFVSPLDSTAWLGARIGSLLLGSSKVGMSARHAKQRVDMGQCAGTVQAQIEREVDLAVANRCEEADAQNRSIWPSMARRNREPWHAAGACNAAYGRMQQKGLFRPKPMKQNHGQHKGAGWL
ncbi:hypothetical protein ZIOFF_061943 [Zingiber officinale]|uniref:Integrase catalytic domain-containing protein n=1 Tax=Zingiber officinale TaxID=94328 RepID=A0A8J5F0X9_ZINOF|nr:hypothetical protein ZIOFF_061943 [Zingiber officinale]